MLSRLIEMVSFILAKSLENEDDDWSVLRSELTEQLQGQGFNGSEIDIAFEMAYKIRSRIEESSGIPFLLKTNQVYQYLEQIKLTKEARGFLMGLVYSQKITPQQREEAVERALFLDVAEVGRQEMQYIVNMVIGGEGWPGEDSPATSFTLQ